ncbi:alpha-ketoglutarate-dependent dioxygenase AlkB [Xanthomonas citri]|uniref:Fe2OG dioxygenase domain-containing protein n=1 Tax=Xanthomonas campestris pv. phaseoli TaxID=317013 RepID=A0A7Z7J4E8_XANCH|nr:conserved hypothetical protein [Xanthomonas citri pv. fuscans]SOO25664.1 conserved hypothetical protein [Xanthomonas phaseoli pv. phaseoli]
MDLFNAPIAPLQVLHDQQGGVRYWPQLLLPALAQEAFDALRDGADWRSQRREMYDRVVDVPRLLASYRLDDALPAGLPLQRLLDAVQAVLPAPYNAVGLNLYRDGRDSVAMHHDALHTLVAPHPIALLSLGAPRRMQLRAKDGSTRAVALELASGSLLAKRSLAHACLASGRCRGHQ